ncbi:GatB/YqeY domain-containing protein [Candidatus Kaiserbacteria bacterium]|nr:GatB/YqeY domain-containing protein [Candidatus Kaiserbacteria bacterium]
MLVHQIKADMIAAMKAKDDLRVQTLRGAIAGFTNELVSKGMKPTDEVTDLMAVSVLKRLAKQRKDSAEQFEKGGRPELAQKELSELKIIEAYLPQTASHADIEKVAIAKKAEMGISDASGAGKLMGAVMKEFAGNADGGDVKEVVASLFK